MCKYLDHFTVVLHSSVADSTKQTDPQFCQPRTGVHHMSPCNSIVGYNF